MKKQIVVVVVAAFILATFQRAEAQQLERVPRIAFLAGGSRAGDSLLLDAFWRRMKERGYVEGKNIAAEYRFAGGVLQRLPALAAELVRLNVDVIVGPGSGATAAKNATKTIPIVMTYASNPVGSGLVSSLSHPGANITGLSGLAPDLGGKQLELLKEAFPKISRVAVLWWTQPNSLLLEDMKVAAGAVRVTLQPVELRGLEDFEPAFSTIKKERANGLIALRNPLTSTQRTRIVDFASKNRLPAIYGDSEFVEPGGLMSYGVDVADLWGRAAVYVDKIFKGAKPADLPVEQPMKFEFIINLKAAKQIGLTLPQSVLYRADKIIR